MRAFVVFGLLLIAPVASAQEDPRIAEARAHFQRGEAHADSGEWALALGEYQQAQAIMEELGDPRALSMVYNVAQANYELRNNETSLAGFQRYLTESGPNAPNRDVAQRRVLELEARIAAEGGDTDPGGDGSAQESGGEVVSPIGVIIASVGAAAIIAGAVVGGLALSEGDAAIEDCDANDRCAPATMTELEDVGTLAGVADGLLFGGLAVAATGVVLMFVLADSGDDASASAFCTPDGCAAAVRGHF